ncbi:MAG TPA: dihydropteroate synthase [Victivallales bacterium]|nr:dihydropteroate synthase [Victivallales bacterium]
MKIKFKTRTLKFDKRTLIMGVHNATPDSFSDGGSYKTVDEEINHCCTMYRDGADIIDIGGESTKPGDNSNVSTGEELSRVLPIIKGIKKNYPNSIISIDTMKPEVAYESVQAGADIINDVSGLVYSEKIAQIASETGAGLILMHMKEKPKTEKSDYRYDNLINDVSDFLSEAVKKAKSYDVNDECIIIDPGLGGGAFGKNTIQNIELLSKINKLKNIGFPILLGASRKSFIGDIINEKILRKRVYGNLAIAAWAAQNNIEIIRVHDVKATSQFLKMYNAIKNF